MQGQGHSLEQVHAQLLKAGAGDGGVEVNALIQAVQLDGGLRGRGQRALGALAGGAQAAQGARVVADVLLVLALELLWAAPGQGGRGVSATGRQVTAALCQRGG
jgi:hypothetical protein